jgi:hypothetical protein
MSSLLGSRFVSKVHPYFAPNGREGHFLRRRGYNPDLQEELLAEATALAWNAWRKDPRCRQYPGKLARWSTIHAVDGRRLCSVDSTSLEGGTSANYRTHRPRAYSNVKIQIFLGRVVAQRMEDEDCTGTEAFESVADPRRDLPPDTVQLRLDFRAWFATLPGREQRFLIMVLTDRSASGYALARRFRISGGRVSQLRRELREGYERFTDGELN